MEKGVGLMKKLLCFIMCLTISVTFGVCGIAEEEEGAFGLKMVKAVNPNMLWNIPYGISMQEAYEMIRRIDGITEDTEEERINARIQGMDFLVRLKSKEIVNEFGTEDTFVGITLIYSGDATQEKGIIDDGILTEFAQNVSMIYNMLVEAFGEEDEAGFSDWKYFERFDIPYTDGIIDIKRIHDAGCDKFYVSYYWNNIHMFVDFEFKEENSVQYGILVDAQDMIYEGLHENTEKSAKRDYFEYVKQQEIGITSFK
ncbi:MAG: hypothetical protein MRZ54_04060 [Clostridiales bacterium]|nr:hypothetical protein [Clostridiales bacterium]